MFLRTQGGLVEEPRWDTESDQAVCPEGKVGIQIFLPPHLFCIRHYKIEDNDDQEDKKALPVKVEPEKGKAEKTEGHGDDKEDDSHKDLHQVVNAEESPVHPVGEEEQGKEGGGQAG